MQLDSALLSWLAPCLVCVAFLLFPAGGRWLDRVWTWGTLRLRTGVRARGFLGLLTFALCLLITAVHGVPLPFVHDELSNLLQADTFVRGRLANPTHPHWEFFEGFHIFHQPAYASKYPPGTAGLLALGQLVGAPIVGVWIGGAGAAAALHWMLEGIVGRRWALVGGVLFVCRTAAGSYFGHSYWGGSLAVLGGALTFGAVQRRVVNAPGALGHGFWLGIGLVLLANTRPYEGLIAGLGAAVWLWTALRRRAVDLPAMLTTVGVLAVGALWLVTYNEALTGDRWTLPYQVHDATYHEAPVLVLQEPRPAKTHRHEIMRQYHAREMEHYRAQRTAPGLLRMVARTVNGIRRFYFGEVLSWLLLLLPWLLWRRRRVRATVGWLALGTGAVSLANWFWPHYYAPFCGWTLALTVALLRQLRASGPRGRSLAGWVVLGAGLAGLVVTPRNSQVGWPRRRASIETELREAEGAGRRHLVFVNYDASAGFHADWVYNSASIDDQPVIWARNLGAAQNEALIDYYPDREVWVLNRPRVDFEARPQPYPGADR